MSYLGFDLGTRMGWARYEPVFEAGRGGSVFKWHAGAIQFTPPHGSLQDGLKFHEFEVAIGGMLTDPDWGRVEAVFFEAVPNHNSIVAAHVYGGFQGILKAQCHKHGIPYYGPTVALATCTGGCRNKYFGY